MPRNTAQQAADPVVEEIAATVERAQREGRVMLFGYYPWYVWVLAYLVVLAAAWLAWRPLGAVVALLAAGTLRVPLVAHAGGWARQRVVYTGAGFGIALAVAWRTLALVSGGGVWAAILLWLVGAMVAGYVGHSKIAVGEDRPASVEACAVIGGIALVVYALASAGALMVMH